MKKKESPEISLSSNNPALRTNLFDFHLSLDKILSLEFLLYIHKANHKFMPMNYNQTELLIKILKEFYLKNEVQSYHLINTAVNPSQY